MINMIPAWVDGQLTPVEKMEVHVRGLRHKAISVFVMDGDKVLLQRRAMCKYHTPGLWANTCCTHPHWRETSVDCAHRRMEEELGITGLELELKDRIEYRADVGQGLTEHEVVDLFVGDVVERPEQNLNPLEVVQTKWMALSDLYVDVEQNPQKYTPWLHIYLSRYSERIFGAKVVDEAREPRPAFVT